MQTKIYKRKKKIIQFQTQNKLGIFKPHIVKALV